MGIASCQKTAGGKFKVAGMGVGVLTLMLGVIAATQFGPLIRCANAQEFQIEAIKLTQGNQVFVTCSSLTNQYYILYFGTEVSQITTPVDMRLGEPGSVQLQHRLAQGEGCAFYRVRQVAQINALDIDGDGFNDVLELRDPFLNPLVFNADSDHDGMPDSFELAYGMNPNDPSDATADYDHDGVTNRQEFENGTDPFTPGYVTPDRVSVSESFVGTADLIMGGQTNAPVSTQFAPAMLQPAIHAGKISAVSGNTLQDANAGFPAAMGATGIPCYVQCESGVIAHIVEVDTGRGLLTVDQDLEGAITTGERYRIRPHLTISAIFGQANNVGLQSGDRFESADQVLLWRPASQQMLAVYCSNQPGAAGWREQSGQPADGLSVPPAEGLEVLRKGPGDAVVYLHGVVRDSPIQITIYEGENRVGLVLTPESVPLSAIRSTVDCPRTRVEAVGGGEEVQAGEVLLAHRAPGTGPFVWIWPAAIGKERSAKQR